MTSFETAAQIHRNTQSDGQAFLPEGVRRVLRQMLFFLGGLLLSAVQLTAGISPFGVCFLAAVPTRYIFAAGTGAAAGYLLTLDSVSALRNVAALISVAVLSRLLCEFERVRRIRLLPSCIAATVILLTGAALLLADGFTLSSAAMLLGESALSFAMTYFFAQALDAVRGLLRSEGLPVQALPGVCVTACLLLSSVSDIAILQISPARIATVVLLLSISRLYCEAGGAIAGLAAAAAFLLDPAVGAGAVGFATAGFAAGICAHTKRGFGVGFALTAMGSVLLFTGADFSAAYLFAEAVIGAILFLCIPKKWRRNACRFIAQRQSKQAGAPGRQAFLKQLSRATTAVEMLSQTVQNASKILDSAVPAQAQTRFARAKEAVCDNCGRYAYCWEQHRRDTLQAFAQMDIPLRESKPLCAENIPAAMQARCIRLTALTESLQRFSMRDAEHSAAQARFRELRQANAERFDGVVDMLEALSAEFAEEFHFDESAASRVCETLGNTYGVAVQNVLCAYTAGDTLRLEMTFPTPTVLPSQADLRETLETVTGRQLELPILQEVSAGTEAIFCERTAFRVEAAAAKIPADREKQSGDSYESFYDGRGGYYVVLSDGMGQGTRAALDSTLAVQMTATLLKAGIDVHSALKMVNASLMLKSDAESLATLDILHIDLYTGEAGFYKAGAAKSLLRRKEKCMEIKRAALPVGILRDVRFGCCTGTLQPGDLVVLASDGVFDYAEQPFKKAVCNLNLHTDCATIAKLLAETVKQKNAAPRSDDITVIALKIRNNAE